MSSLLLSNHVEGKFNRGGEKAWYIHFGQAFGVCTCTAGKKEIFIRSDGALFSCPNFMDEPYQIGNILGCSCIEELLPATSTNPFCEKILTNHPLLSSACMNCTVKSFCWTCPGEAHDYDSKEEFKNRCKLFRPVLMKRVWEDERNI